MREYHILRTACRIFFIAFAITSFVSQTSYSQVAELLPLDDPNAVAQMVLSAMKNIQLPKSGRGTAIMKTMHPVLTVKNSLWISHSMIKIRAQIFLNPRMESKAKD